MATASKSMASDAIASVFKMVKDRNVKIIDLKFCDMLGQWQHFSVLTGEFSEDVFENGIGFDGSSIRGFQKIHESDMLLFPDPISAFVASASPNMKVKPCSKESRLTKRLCMASGSRSMI